ncbi:MAG TPA: queuosine precursor transporter [Verrucomicrobiae bacterium]|jgi:hypothetical protein|nr:queuosine precursor transporter [Verrucomicrobiae bacterium]
MTIESAKLRITESERDWVPKHYDIITISFVTTLLVSNLLATKLFQCGPAIFSAGILVFPISYIFGDVLTEVYGFNRTRRIIYMGLIANVFMSLALYVAIKLPPAPGWTMQTEFSAIYSLVPRIVIASALAYLAGELTNSAIVSRLKMMHEGRHLWLRLVCSTAAGQLVDTMLFVIIGFAGVFDNHLLVLAVISGWLFKVLYEIIAIPVTYRIVAKLKALEGVEHFDKKDRIRLFKAY